MTFVKFVVLATVWLCLAERCASTFISYCSNHNHGNRHMTSISLKNVTSGELYSHHPSNFSDGKFRRIACSWRLLFEDYISELDDLVPPPRSTFKQATQAKIQRSRPKFHMGLTNGHISKAIRLDFSNFDIPEVQYDPLEITGNVTSDVNLRCKRNYIKVSYIDVRSNLIPLGHFCGKIDIPPLVGDADKSILIEVQIFDRPLEPFKISFKTMPSIDRSQIECPAENFACPSGKNDDDASRCIPNNFKCDELSDCRNGIDEKECKMLDAKPKSADFDYLESVGPIEKPITDSGCSSPRYQLGISGNFSSKNYPDRYENNLRCVWVITTPPDTKILLTFDKKFDVESSEFHDDCPFDHLTFYPRGSSALKFGQRLCGAEAKPRIIGSPWLMVVFETDSEATRSGFQLTWKAIKAKDEAKLTKRNKLQPPIPTPPSYTEQSCSTASGVKIVNHEGFIQSPSYGQMSTYPSSLTCRWVLKPRPVKANSYDLQRIEFRFLDFSIQSSKDCRADFLMIQFLDKKGEKQWARFCDIANPPPFEESISIETQTGAGFVFKSDSWRGGHGFLLQYRAIFRENQGGEVTKDRSKILLALGEGEKMPVCGVSSLAEAPPTPHFDVSSPFVITGLSPVQNQAFPWIIQLFYESKHRCVGTLIGQGWAVAAGSCFPREPGALLKWKARMAGESEDIQISAIYIHTKFGKSSSSKEFDVAVVKLNSKSQSQQPICLPSRNTEKLDRCVAVGWHESKLGTRNHLKQVHMPIVSRQDCHRRHLMYEAFVTSKMLCAGYEIGPQRICHAILDNSSPLICNINSKWEIHGILAFSKGCSGSMAPSVFTRLFSYSDWIQKVVAKFS